MAGDYPKDWPNRARRLKMKAGWRCELCDALHDPPRHVITVDHLDFDPANCAEDNLMVLCARCHLKRQQLRPTPVTRAEVIKRFSLKGTQLALPGILNALK